MMLRFAEAYSGLPPGEQAQFAEAVRRLLSDGLIWREIEGDLGSDGRVSLAGTPFLAGSSLTLDQAIANTVRFTGFSLENAISMASVNPARYVGMSTAGTVAAEWDAERCALRVAGTEAEGATA